MSLNKYIAIHNGSSGFHRRWLKYCQEQNLPYKLVDCYSSSIISELKDCKILFWHHHHRNPKDILIAKEILFALEHSGLKVFPNFKTGWHFDDKVAQKYLFEALGLPHVPSYVFFDKVEALTWIEKASFPIVWKLRRGAGSANVALVESPRKAKVLIRRSFGNGFKQYSAWGSLKERIQKYKNGKTEMKDLLKGILRLVYEPQFSRIIGKETGYIYFQDFIPNLICDYRIIVIDGKAFAIKRYVRKNDFRASGSGNLEYDRHNFSSEILETAFNIAEKLRSDSCVLDFVFHEDKYLLVEVSYGFPMEGFADDCPGYWDKNLDWHEGNFNPQGWIIESFL